MKLQKLVLFSTITSILVTGCSSSKTVKTPIIKDNVNYIAKKSKLSTNQQNNWQHLDLETDSIPGMSTDKAHKFLQGKKGKDIVVAIIDTGIDFTHEDLKEVAWVNTKEIAGNGIDDDKNGYIDDVHGWNFLGKMKKAHFEEDRILANPSISNEKVVTALKAERELEIKRSKERIPIIMEDKVRSEKTLRAISNADKAFRKHFQKKDYTKKDILSIQNADENLAKHIAYAKQLFEYGGNSIKAIKSEVDFTIKSLNDEYNEVQKLVSGTITANNYRKILGENSNDINDRDYGDYNVKPMSESEMHGSHVAGIVAAKRNNNVGMNGVANNVKIMSLRAVPGDGDEHDKDIALAIRYAVNNGAKVINGSFGKSYSPYKKWVYDAIKYAADNDVLIINAAGNSGDNIDKIATYPNDTPNQFKELADNFLVVGASGFTYDESIVAHFSNYGKHNVDVFAPGVEIYSTTPNNKYERSGGTSMAAPNVAGIAALVRSYYPSLTASEVKHIIMNSGIKIGFNVSKPTSMTNFDMDFSGGEETGAVLLSDLSVSGRIVNAYNAVVMANELVNGKK